MWTGVAFSLLLVPYLYKNGLAVHEALVAPNPMKSPPWRSLAWLNQHTPSDVQVLSDIATNVELYTDRQAVVEVSATSSEMFLYRLIQDHLEYIVYRQLSFVSPGVVGADDPNLVWNQMAEWFTRHADRFPLVFADAAEQTGVFHVAPEPGFSDAFEKIKEATQAYQADRLDDALQLAQQSIAIDPKVGEAFNLLGAIYLRQNNRPDAERAWLRATQLLPDSPNAMVNLATLYQMRGQTERVSEYLRRAKEIADRNGLQVIFQSNMDDLQRQWDHHKARIFIDPLNFTLHHSPTVAG
jgi:tetratricopeptide (TPR) repeat protein